MGRKDSRRIDMEYVPARNFAEQSARSSLVAPRRSDYVPSRYLNPDFSVLDVHQTAFYRHWKDMVTSMEVIPADIGYVNLFISETMLSEAPADAKIRRLLMLYNNADGIGFDRRLITGTIFDLAVSDNLPLPVVDYMDPSHREALVSGILSSPYSGMPEGFSELVLGTRLSEENARVLDSTLRRYEEFVSTTRGRDIPGSFDKGDTVITRRLFEDRPFMNGESVDISFPRADVSGKLGRFLESVVKAVVRRDPSVVPRSLGEQIRSFLEESLSEEGSTGPGYVAKTGYVVRHREYKVVMHEFNNTPPCSLGIMSDFMRNWQDYSRDVHPYVPSGASRTEYATMDDSQEQYYRYWKGCMVQGGQLETDNGYVWLYMSEQLANCPNKGTMYQRLKDLYEAYGTQDHSGLIRDTFGEFAIANKMQVPFAVPGIRESSDLAMMSLLDGEDVTIDSDCLLKVAHLEKSRVSEEFDEQCASAVVATIRDVSALLSSRNKRLADCFPCDRKPFKMQIYQKLRVFTGRRSGSVWAEYPALSDNLEFCDFLEALIVDSVRCSKRLSDGRNRRLLPYRIEGIDCETLVERNVYNMRNTRKKNVELNLDFKQVFSAERDLEEVTNMMAVPEEEPVATAPERISRKESRLVRRKTGNRWRTLVERLDDIQRNYLLGAVDGKVKRVDHRIEDAINDIALSIVDDTIVEAGKVYEDYEEDVRGGF
ncbi:MAG: hypothetical protein MJZ38_00990 [archaeon]|nr:hypothetical protein [archaeon]